MIRSHSLAFDVVQSSMAMAALWLIIIGILSLTVMCLGCAHVPNWEALGHELMWILAVLGVHGWD